MFKTVCCSYYINTMEVLKNFVANIIDVYHPSVLDKFVQGNEHKVNIDMILAHNITKLNVLFCKVWITMFDTYPSKKHFQDYLLGIIPIDKAFNSTIQKYDDAVLQSMISSVDVQNVCRYGFIPPSEYQKVKGVFVETVPRLQDKEYVKEVLVDKWKFRFGYQNTSTNQQTILKSFIAMYNRTEQQLCNGNYSDFTGFSPDVDGHPLQLTDDDKRYMNQREVFQYYLHKNNRFLMQLASHVVIVNDTETENNNIGSLVETVQDVTKQQTLVLNLMSCVSDSKVGKAGTLFVYSIPKSFYDLIPNMVSNMILVSCDSRVVKRPLCKKEQNSIHVYVGDKFDHSNHVDGLYRLTLSTCCKNTTDRSVYYLPPTTHSLYSWAWKHYLTLQCPFKTPHPINNVLIFVDFIAKLCVKSQKSIIDAIQKPRTPCKTKHCIVVVDTRFNILTLWSIFISLANALDASINGVQWNAIIYTSPKASSQYKEAMLKLGLTNTKDIIKIQNSNSLDCKLFHMEIYNAFLKNASFWKGLQDQGFKKCLIVQDDGMLLNGKHLEHYLQYDYVGAPWMDAPDNSYIKQYINSDLVGNGGFSLRDVQKSYEVCTSFKDEKNQLFYHNINEIPEDVYFVKCLKSMGGNASVAPFNEARRFSVEQVFQHSPCGFHKFWMYHSPQDTLKLFNSWLS